MRPLRWLAALAMLAYARLWRWLVGIGTLVLGRALRGRKRRREEGREQRIVPAGSAQPRAEIAVVVLLALSALFAVGFVVVYGVYSPAKIPNELLGVCMGGALAFIAAALAVLANHLVVTEELEEPYPEEHPDKQQEIVEIVHESGSRITRRRLLIGAGAAAGGALGASALAPALSLGPLWDTRPLYETPWRRGLRLVDERGTPYKASDIEEGAFYTAFPEGANQSENIGAPLIVVRLTPGALRLPPERADWAPEGILAYSKICTHAGCAIALYRKPTFPVVEPKPALVCPCHYSTFDPARAGAVTYGPAGRPLPQLPLEIDGAGYLRAANNFSGPVGPSWWGVRSGPAKTGPAT
jgi:quinol---cytochrome c reductase iron-sulfur subunit